MFSEFSASFVVVNWRTFVTENSTGYFHLPQLHFPDSKKLSIRFYANKSSSECAFQLNSMSIYIKGYWHFWKKSILSIRWWRSYSFSFGLFCHQFQKRADINLTLLQWRRNCEGYLHMTFQKLFHPIAKKKKISGTVLCDLLAFDKMLALGSAEIF